MALVGTSAVTAVRKFYERLMLARALPFLLHNMFGQRKNIPQNKGEEVNFRKYSSLGAQTTPLVEGVTPAGQSVTVTDIPAKPLQYGGWIRFSDLLAFTTEDPISVEFTELLAEQAGLTIDQLTRNILHAGTNVQYAGAAVSRVTVAAGMVLNDAELKEALVTARKNNIRPVTTIILPSEKYATSPIKPSYIGLIAPEIVQDVEALTGFVAVEKYASYQPVHESEIGSAFNVRWLCTSEAKVFAGAGAAGIDVFSTLLIGRVGLGITGTPYGITGIDTHVLEQIYKAPGSAGADDPLNQRGSYAWKAMHVAKILQTYGILRIEHAET